MAKTRVLIGEGVSLRTIEFRYKGIVLAMLVVCFVMSGCTGSENDDAHVSQQTVVADSAPVLSTVEPTSTVAADPLPTNTAEPTEIVMESEPSPVPPTAASPTDESSDPTGVEVVVTIDASLADVRFNENFYVSYNNASPVVGDSIEGQLVSFTVSLGSQSELGSEVTADALVFIDQSGASYEPLPAPEVGYQPYLIGAEIEPQSSVVGFVIFDLPAELEEGVLVWCPEEAYPCGAPAEVKIDGLP